MTHEIRDPPPIARRDGTLSIESKVQSPMSKVEDQRFAILTLDFGPRDFGPTPGTGHVVSPRNAQGIGPHPGPHPTRLSSPKSTRSGRARGWLGARRDTSAIGSQRSITDGFEPRSHQDHQGRQNPLGVTYSLVAWWLEIRIQSRRDGTRCFTEKCPKKTALTPIAGRTGRGRRWKKIGRWGR